MYVDVKESMWTRYYIDDEDFDVNNLADIEEGLYEVMANSYDPEPLYDTADSMTIAENDGFSTVELYDDNHNLIWSNGKS